MNQTQTASNGSVTWEMRVKIIAEEGTSRLVSVSNAGDVNGDGIDDIILGDYLNGEGGALAGAAYVVFGGASPQLDLGAVAGGSGGFKLVGENAGDRLGTSVSAAGDVNGDGFDDIIVGASLFDSNFTNEGAAYVVFGGLAPETDLANIASGTGGFLIEGETSAGTGLAGTSVSAAGDVNGDGFDDVIVGAPFLAPDATYGGAYVVFGQSNFGSLISLDDVATGSDGFRLRGQDLSQTGGSVSSAGDVNGDGLADIIVGAEGDNGDFGAAYVVFGSTVAFSGDNDLDALAATTGAFKITGEVAGDFAGISVSSAGDVDGDGVDDLLIGATGVDAGTTTNIGAAYLVFGVDGGSANIDLNAIANGVGGIKLTGENGFDQLGNAVSAAGDLNGDGFDDVIIGASYNDEGGNGAGAGYVLFGTDVTGKVTVIGTEFDDILTGTVGDDVIVSGKGNDIINGRTAGANGDVIRAGAGDDEIDINTPVVNRIDGGAGSDTLLLTGGFGLDLTALGDSAITSIETIEFNFSGQTELTLAASDVRAMSSTNTLTVQNSDSPLSFEDDTVRLDGVWNFEGSTAGVHGFQENQISLNADVTTLTNIGTVTVDTDATLGFSNSTDIFTNSQDMFFGSGATLTVDTGTLHNDGGVINGDLSNAIVEVNGGSFIQGGTLNFGTSPGGFTVFGDMTNEHTASMLIELGGLEGGISEGFDQLTVTGNFTAGGVMDVVEFGGFEVSAGDSFAVVETGSVGGSFDDITGLDVGGGVVLDATQSDAGVTLTGRAVTHQGTTVDDTLTGSAGDDVFLGDEGNDFILGGGGADLMHGGGGDDLFVATDTGFGRIDGGDGFDTVLFEGAGQSFDLGGLRGDQINAIEGFDLTGTGDNTLTLDADMVFSATRGANALTGMENSLIIDGDAGDTVDAGAGWSNTGTVTIGGDGYSVFESADNGAQLFVNNEVAVA